MFKISRLVTVGLVMATLLCCIRIAQAGAQKSGSIDSGGIVGYPSKPKVDTEKQKLQQQIADLSKAKQELGAEVERLKNEVSRLKSGGESNSKTSEIATLKSKNQSLEGQLERFKALSNYSVTVTNNSADKRRVIQCVAFTIEGDGSTGWKYMSDKAVSSANQRQGGWDFQAGETKKIFFRDYWDGRAVAVVINWDDNRVAWGSGSGVAIVKHSS